MLHRDLKPSNILLAADGTPKVSDFGMAKRTDVDSGLTDSNGPLGTPAYMPPEQLARRHGAVGRPADVYGLGATLYDLVTGLPPFAADTLPELFSLIETDLPARPRSLRPDLPLELEAVVMKCLEKNPARRYPTAEAVAADLDRFLAGQTPTAPRLTRKRRAVRWVGRHSRVGIALAVGLIAVTVAAAFAPRRPGPAVPEPDPVAEVRQELAAGRPVTLIGETGRPRYHRWAVNQGEIVAQGDDTFTVRNGSDTLLELFPDPGIDRYRISVEVRQLESAAQRTGAQTAGHGGGFYFGYDVQPTANGGRVHTFAAVRIADYQPNPAKPVRKDISYEDRFLPQLPLVRGGGGITQLHSVPCEPVPLLPGPWRRFEIELTPEQVRLDFGPQYAGKRFVAHDAAGMQARVDYIQRELEQPTWAKYLPGVRLAPWSPRRPIGLHMYGATIAVRNLVVTPLPNPDVQEPRP